MDPFIKYRVAYVRSCVNEFDTRYCSYLRYSDATYLAFFYLVTLRHASSICMAITRVTLNVRLTPAGEYKVIPCLD